MDNFPPASEMFLLNCSGPGSLDIFQGHSKATMLLIVNNAAQGILSSFFFKYAGEIITQFAPPSFSSSYPLLMGSLYVSTWCFCVAQLSLN